MTNPLFDALIGDKAKSPAPLFKEPGGQDLSYADVAAKAGSFAHALTRLGLRPGDRVMVQAEKSVDVVILYLAALRMGAVFVPLNTAYTPAEVAYFVEDAEPGVLICDPQAEETLKAVAEPHGTQVLTLGPDGSGSWYAFAGDVCSAVYASERSTSDIATILYTSGTTGRSKGAMLTHGNLLSNAQTLAAAWRFSADDILLHILPVYHAHGLFVAINVAMVSGASIILQSRFDTGDVVANLPDATVMMGVPTHYTRLLADERFDRAVAGHMRLFTSGSAPLLASTHEVFSARTGHAILERYGLTETTMNTSNLYDGARKPGTVGPALDGIDVRVVGDDGKPVAAGETGAVEVNGPNVFAGYWRKPEKTYSEFTEDGFFKTGDLGMFDEDGYLTIVGRAKDLVISGGLNVYPKEVEDAIDAVEGVIESAVVGVPDDDFGEAVTAVVVAKSESETSELEARIRGDIADRLAKFKQPKSYVFVDALPRNTMGKVQKNLLRDRLL